MAIDEVLFSKIESADLDFYLRFYSMCAPSVTVGYFSMRKNAPVLTGLAETMSVVRRSTGGGIVFHGTDLVFSFGARVSEAPFLKSTTGSYRWIHERVREAFEKFGIKTELWREGQSMVTTSLQPSLCFENPVPGDLMLGEKKVVGGAERRKKGSFLYQGSVTFDFNEYNLDRRAFSQAIQSSFEKELKIKFASEEMPSCLRRQAEELAESRFQTVSKQSGS